MTGDIEKKDLASLTVRVVESYLSHNKIEMDSISNLINLVHASLSNVMDKDPVLQKTISPAVQVQDSIHPDYIICLEDGKKLKMLKRYLKRAYNLTPEQYRKRWSLDSSYPMVAPNYSKKRSSLAKGFGLGAGSTEKQWKKT